MSNSLATPWTATAPHSSTLAWKIPWTKEPGGLQSMGSQRVGDDWATSLPLFTFMTGEGNGNPLQCSCLENPRDEGIWWAAVYGVAQSGTRLKRLSSSSSSVAVVSSSLATHGLQHTRLPCPSLSPRVCSLESIWVFSNWCPSSHWCPPSISSSIVPPSPSGLNLSQHQGLSSESILCIT